MDAFKSIIGYESVKKELYQIIDMFKNSEKYVEMGAKLPRGILIFGVPGLGKTMLANAFIKECNVPTYILRKNKKSSESIDEIRESFEKAAKEEKAIVFIDDLDKFSETKDLNYDDEAFVSIQAGIDSVKDKNVIVLATVNNLQKLPNSLSRNGRFDRRMRLSKPSNEDAAKIIEFYLKDKKVDKNLNYEDVCKMISYVSCADLDTILNESAIYAAYERKECIDINDISKAYLRDCYAIPEGDFKCSDEELDAVCIHEAGHAVVAEAIKNGSVGYVTVQPIEDSARGFTHICENISRRPELILTALAGKVAVELFYGGKCASGCHSDLKHAFNLIRDGISESGTLGMGMIDVANDRFPTTSESMNSRNEAVVQAELERFIYKTRDILLKNKNFLVKLVDKLKEKKTLLYSDIQSVRSNCEVIQAIVD